MSRISDHLRVFLRSVCFSIRKPKNVECNSMQNISLSAEVKAIKSGRIVLDGRVTCYQRVSLVANGGCMTIANHVAINRNCIFVCRDKISIGANCVFGPNVIIYDHDHVYKDSGYVMEEFNTSPVIIEDNCWIGANVTILRGTYIGKGSIVGAGTIVKGTIPPHSLVRSKQDMIIKPL